MGYLEFANSSILTLLVGAILIFVTIVCIIFLKKGWTEAKRLGITDKELKKIVGNSIGISLIPSIPIVLSVMVMVPVLGVGLPWLRTSVIGSANNELISATMAVEASGIAFSAETMTVEAFINASWAMMLGCSVALPMALIALKPVCKTYETFKKKDSRWITIFSLGALVTVIAAFSVSYAFKGLIPCIVILASFIFAYVCTLLAKKESLKWMKDYSFPLTIIFGLIVALVITPIIG